MAIVVRYFSTTGAGAEDGTTWADRAPFISGGAYSTILTGFDFNSADSLECRLGPGTYTMPASLTSARFTSNLPRPQYPLLIHGCDASGDRIVPDPWNCAQGALPVTGYPVLDFGSSYQYDLNNAVIRCLSLTGSFNGTLCQIGIGGACDFCRLECTGSGVLQNLISLLTLGRGVASNTHAIATGTAYNFLLSGNAALFNCRIEGNASATSGNRGAMLINSGEVIRHASGNLCVINCPGIAFSNSSASSLCGFNVSQCTIVNCGTAVDINTGAGGTDTQGGKAYIASNFIANCTTGVDALNAAAILLNNRLRNTTNLSVVTNSIDCGNFTASGNDADEFVDAANGDYRIKKTSIYWGKGIGAGDEPASGGTSRPINPFYQGVIG